MTNRDEAYPPAGTVNSWSTHDSMSAHAEGMGREKRINQQMHLHSVMHTLRPKQPFEYIRQSLTLSE